MGLILAAPAGKSALAEYNLPYIGEMKEIRAEYEDTFVHLARDYNIGFVEMRAANPYVDPWLPGKGTKLTLPTLHILPDAPHEGIVINLADMRLYAYFDKNQPPFSTPVGVGREGLNTPLGTTTIVRKVEGPIWRPTDRMRKEDPKLPPVVYPGDDNPMGTHAMYLGWSQYAIHGTNKPFGIGRRSSSGCLRLYPEAITQVYDMFPVGTKVTVVNQPIKLAWIGDELFLEVSPTVEQSVQMEEMGEVKEQKLTNDEMRKIIEAAGEYQDRLRWPTIRTAIKERRSYPIAIARRPSATVAEDKTETETPEEGKNLVEDYKPARAMKTGASPEQKPVLLPHSDKKSALENEREAFIHPKQNQKSDRAEKLASND